MSLILIIILSLLMSAFFSGMEMAFVTANRLRIELDKKQGHTLSGIIARYINNPSQYLATMLIGNNIALVVYGLIMAKVLDPYVDLYVEHAIFSLLIKTFISTLIILILAEYLPKSLFRINPNNSLRIFAIPVLVFYILFYPIAAFTTQLSSIVIRLFFRVKIDKKVELKLTKQDLDHLLNENVGEEVGTKIFDQDVKIFQNALDFSEVKIRECYIPRTEIQAISIDDSVDNLRQKFIDTGLSKILVYQDSMDNIVGFAPSIRLFKKPESIKSMVRRLPIVPETMSANKLLASFIQSRKNIALVVDEYGGTSGIVTMEDIIEEIVGDIQDEHDTVRLIEEKLDENVYRFSGRMEIDDIVENYGIDIPDSEDFETIAGYILSITGSIPSSGEIVENEKYIFEIEEASSTRIELVKLTVKVAD